MPPDSKKLLPDTHFDPIGDFRDGGGHPYLVAYVNTVGRKDFASPLDDDPDSVPSRVKKEWTTASALRPRVTSSTTAQTTNRDVELSGPSEPLRSDIKSMIDNLDEKIVRDALFNMVISSEQPRSVLANLSSRRQQRRETSKEPQHEDTTAATSKKEEDFNYSDCSKAVYRILKNGADLQEGSGIDAAFEAFNAINKYIDIIKGRLGQQTTYQNSVGALDALHRISSAVFVTTGTLGEEVKKLFQLDFSISEAMHLALWSHGKEERIRIGQDRSSGLHTLLERMRVLVSKARGQFGNADGLQRVVQLLEGGDEGLEDTLGLLGPMPGTDETEEGRPFS